MQIDGKSMSSDVSATRGLYAFSHPESALNAQYQCSGGAVNKQPIDRLARLHLGKKLKYVLPCIKGAFAVGIRQPARGLEILGNGMKDEG